MKGCNSAWVQLLGYSSQQFSLLGYSLWQWLLTHYDFISEDNPECLYAYNLFSRCTHWFQKAYFNFDASSEFLFYFILHKALLLKAKECVNQKKLDFKPTTSSNPRPCSSGAVLEKEAIVLLSRLVQDKCHRKCTGEYKSNVMIMCESILKK